MFVALRINKMFAEKKEDNMGNDKIEKIKLLAHMAFIINHFADKYDAPTTTLIRQKINEGTLFDFLSEHNKKNPSLMNNLPYSKEDFAYLQEVLERTENAYTDKKCGIEKNGYHLLSTFLLFSISGEID